MLGPTIFRSTDAGRTFSEATRPPAFDKAGPGERPRVMSHTFWLTPGHPDEPGVWFAGSSPQALWRSEDAGQTWASVRGFNDHPDYEARTEDPQAGTPDGPILHSILIDPRDARHMYLGLSGGGVYETLDHGETWSALNLGMATASTEPEAGGMEINYGDLAWSEVGPQHDPHCVQLFPGNPDILHFLEVVTDYLHIACFVNEIKLLQDMSFNLSHKPGEMIEAHPLQAIMDQRRAARTHSLPRRPVMSAAIRMANGTDQPTKPRYSVGGWIAIQ